MLVSHVEVGGQHVRAYYGPFEDSTSIGDTPLYNYVHCVPFLSPMVSIKNCGKNDFLTILLFGCIYHILTIIV